MMRMLRLALLAALLLGSQAHAQSLVMNIALHQRAAPFDLYFQTMQVFDPRITFARASPATLFNPAGTLQTVGNNVPRFGTFTVAGGQPSFMMEGAATNSALWSRDLTQSGTWTASNATLALDQIGIDGAANSASSFLATANNATICQAITASSQAWGYSVFLERLVGTGAVSLSLDGGSTYTAETITSSYSRPVVTQTLANPTMCIKLGTSGDKIAVDYDQLESPLSAHTFYVAPSTPILTTVAAATRANETASMPYVPGPSLSFQADHSFPTDTSTDGQEVVQIDNAGTGTNRVQLSRVGTSAKGRAAVFNTSPSVNWQLTTTAAITDIIEHRRAISLQTGSLVGFDDGLAIPNNLSTGSVTVPLGITTLRFGNHTQLVDDFFGTIYRVTLWPYALSPGVLARNSLGW